MKIIRFTAGWCGPCKQLAPMLEDIKESYKENCPEIQTVDIDEDMSLPVKYGIRGVPTLVKVNEQGFELDRLVGVTTKNKLTDWVLGIKN